MSNHVALEAMKSRARGILVADLKEVCRNEGLTVSGPKSLLQNRIISRIDDMVATGNHVGIQSMRTSLQATGNRAMLPAYNAQSSSTSISFRPSTTMNSVYGNGTSMARSTLNFGLQFKPSPFYEPIEPLAKHLDMPPFPNHRNQATVQLQLTAPVIDRLRNDSSTRVLVYCAPKDELLNSNRQCDVSFPHQIEIKVNDQEVRANFKGVKNKPGSTRPVDITAFITKQQHFMNRIMVTYALTQKAGDRVPKHEAQGYSIIAMLVKKHSIDELVQRIRKGKVITKETVESEMRARASDPDLVVGDTIMSLKDPVSYVRIAVPCRSDVCTHHQCFDAASFLQLQEQAPTWTCPICNKVVSFAGLVVDQYFEDILRRTSTATLQVTVEPKGTWAVSGGASSGQYGNHDDDSDDYDDDNDNDEDVVEVRPSVVKSESFGGSGLTPYSMSAPTPPRNSPMAAPAPVSAARAGQKRKSEVIVISDDDDDDDDEAPPARRPAYHTPNSLPDHSRPGARTNGYSTYPHHNPSTMSNNRANTPVRFQLGDRTGNSSGNNSAYAYNNWAQDSGVDDGSLAHLFGNADPSYGVPRRTVSSTSHRPSPLSGSALAPIDLDDSPPRRPPATTIPSFSDRSSSSVAARFNNQLPSFSDLDFGDFSSPPPIPESASLLRNANARMGNSQLGLSEQRAALMALGHPYGRQNTDKD